MKIAVVGTRGFPNVQGGVEAHCENLYPLLAQKGCEVTVFARRPYLSSNQPFIYRGVNIVPLACPKNRSLEAFLHTIYGIFQARKLHPDLLHIHAVGPALCVPLARLLGLKVVMTHHGPDYQRKKWGRLAKSILKLGEYTGSSLSQSVIAVSDQIASGIREKYKRKVYTIPNGVGAAEFQDPNGGLKKYSLTKEKYILAVGRFVPEKGFLDLVAAFEKIEEQDWKLVIVGRADHSNSYSLELEKMAKNNKNIILTGFLSGVSLQEIFSNAGLFVLPSYYEGLPIALLEALSYGLSSIASNIPANKEVGLSENRYFQAGDIHALTEKIREFIAQPMSETEQEDQIKQIKEKYNWGKIAESTWEVYLRVISKN